MFTHRDTQTDGFVIKIDEKLILLSQLMTSQHLIQFSFDKINCKIVTLR